jgi:hypothetical protein
MGVEFFVDAGLGFRLVEGLRSLGYENIQHIHEKFPVGTLDEEWLEYVGKNKLVVITKDKMIRKNPKEKAALLKYGIVAFYLGGDKLSIREIASQLINAWDKMEACALKQQKKGVAGAFVIRPRGGKIEEIPLT